MGAETVPIKEESEGGVSELDKKIIRQVEYYFGNYNLCKDKFLREQIKLDDGWVPLETLTKFNRLKILSNDYQVICDALRKSDNDLMEVSEDSTKVRRRVEKPLPQEPLTKEAMEERTLYVKGFKKSTTLDELLEYFREYKAEHIYMRRVRPNNVVFKGSCFVLFETKDDAEKFFDLKGIKFENIELLKEKKKDYMARKDIFFDNLRAEKEKKSLKKGEGNKANSDEVQELEMIPGCLLKIVGLVPGTIREDIKEPLETYGTIVFVDHFRSKPEAVVRFETGVAATALEGATFEEDGVRKMEIKSAKVTVSLIEGEEEKEYWKNIAVSKANARLRHNQYQKQNRGRFRKNWGKRRNQNDEDENCPRSKKMKRETNEEVKTEIKQEKSEAKEEKSEAKEEKSEAKEERSKVKEEKIKTIKEDSVEMTPVKSEAS